MNDGTISRLEGMFLFAGLVGYIVYSIREARTETPAARSEYEEEFASVPFLWAPFVFYGAPEGT
jgi:Ca2+/Na+ antiporter